MEEGGVQRHGGEACQAWRTTSERQHWKAGVEPTYQGEAATR